MSKINDVYDMLTDKTKQHEYNDEIVRKTRKYQQNYGFKTSSIPKHEFWNNEADAFKHAFGSADMSFKYGHVGSLGAGVWHEWQTSHNPQGEWNMDSWNNNQGREIAKEILSEYGDKFNNLSPKQKDDIIAEKVMNKMRKGQLITDPGDRRKFTGPVENVVNYVKKTSEFKMPNPPFVPTRGVGRVQSPVEIARQTGFAAPVEPVEGIESGLSGYTNPITGNNRIYTREDIDNMSSEEFSNNEKEIMSQMNTIGVPTDGDMKREVLTGGGVVYVNAYTRSDGTNVRGYYRSR